MSLHALLPRALVTAGFVGLLAYMAWNRQPSGSAAIGSPLAFEEVSKACGMTFVHHAPKLDPKIANVMADVASMGAAVSMTDANGDGWPDAYVTNSAYGQCNALFVNQQDGRFEDQAARAGLANVNQPGEGVSMGSIWADVDNDGDEDVYLYKWGYAQLFRNDGALAFTDITPSSGLRRWINANTAVWLDYDRDGLLDLFTAGYWADDVDLWHLKTTRIRHNSSEFATNGGSKRLYHSLGGGRFEERTELLGKTKTRWALGSAAADFDEDGWIDLYVANDYGPEELFLNRQGERFEQLPAGLEESSKSGMCVAVGDFQNSGRLGTYVTNISNRGHLFQGNNLRENRLDSAGVFENLVDDPGSAVGGVVADCGWAWGAQFGDLDRDGWCDLFVANGYISADREHDYWYEMMKVAGGAGDLLMDAITWPELGNKSLSGYEVSRVLLNKRGKTWVDVAKSAGVTDEYDGRAVALADLWNRGCLDVLVANQKGPLLVYKNRKLGDNHWIAFELVGKRSNKSAIGAQITLHYGGMRQTRVVDGGSGFCSQNDRRPFFGLGQAVEIDKAVLRWPSGRVQELPELKIDAHNRIEEP